MHNWWSVLWVLLACLSWSPWLHAQASAEPATEAATLHYANREIATFHARVAGVSPQDRAERAADVLRAMGDTGRRGAVTVQRFVHAGQPAVAVRVGDRVVFSLLPGDTRVEGRPLEQESEVVRQALEAALMAERVQRRPDVLLRGIGLTVGAAALALLLLWVVGRAANALEAWLLARITSQTQTPGDHFRWREYARPLLIRVIGLLRWVIYFLLVLGWLVIALEAFPLTYPLGSQLQAFFGDKLHEFARAAVSAMPGLVTVLLILFLTRAVSEGVQLFFDNVQSSRIRAPFVHRETASATKRLVKIVIWGMGVAIAYPYIPGSSSDAFKGVSVMFGLVLTLGSAGIVNQLMSGLVVVYSRALRRGDFVEVDGIEARVVEVGGLATKLVNLNRQEITIPNSVLIANSVRNYTKRAESEPIYLSVKVTIGYDAPWRQVHQILLDAAAATPELAKQPSPFVLQRALGDFYVEYEVFAALDDPITQLQRKPMVMSGFNANIQDSFNSQGVQIMSPHFEAQPEQAVTVPRTKWFANAPEAVHAASEDGKA
ncbi:mechanosensitive ion channel family protein [Lysobacter cavernae]|uniref:Small-conductance mechanosensitive channel n=1 Tax=Lysobacter cavernae TaxID=1685901 RepID=A0ABV7RRL5_9GAMM